MAGAFERSLLPMAPRSWLRAAMRPPTQGAARWPLYATVAAVYAATWIALWDAASPGLLVAVAGAFALFVLSQVLGERMPPRRVWAVRGFLGAQVLLVVALNRLVPGYVTMVLYFIPAVRAFVALPVHEAVGWALGLAGLVALQHGFDFDPQHGMTMALIYSAGFAFFGAVIVSLRHAELARERSDRLLVELTGAHAQLRDQAERAERQAHELATLSAVSRSVTARLEMAPLMGTILDELKRVVDYSAVSVRLLEGADLVMLAYRGADEAGHWARARTPLVESPAVQEVMRRRGPLMIGDFQADEPALLDDFRCSHPVIATLRGQMGAWLGVPLLVRDEVIGAIVLSHGEAGFYTPHHAELAQAFANHAAIAVDNARLYGQAQEAAAREERQRLARELHDAVTQTLFSASLIAEVLPRLWERNPAEARRRLEELRQLTRGALAEMRTLLLELRPAALVDTPLRDLLRQLCEAVTGRARIPITLHLDEPAPSSPPCDAGTALPPDVQVALYRIAQEALHNAVKHAGATQCGLSLRQGTDLVELRIEDDGIGFEPGAASAEHLGLRIMRERAEAVGAALHIESRQALPAHLARPAQSAQPAQLRHGTTITVVWQAPQQTEQEGASGAVQHGEQQAQDEQQRNTRHGDNSVLQGTQPIRA